MDFEAISLYNKIILGPATPKEVRNVTNKQVLQKQKNVLGKSEATLIKNIRFVTAQKGGVKKKINEQEMTEHFCSRSTCLPQKVLRTSELYGIEADGLTVNENI